MFIPSNPPPTPIDLTWLEEQTVVEARVLRTNESSSVGPFIEPTNVAQLNTDCLMVLPFCSIADVRDLSVLTNRFSGMQEKLNTMLSDKNWRLCIRYHFVLLQENLIPAEINTVAQTLHTTVPYTEKPVRDLVDSFRHMVALGWLTICSEIKLHELVVQELGESMLTNAERYRGLLETRTNEPEARVHFRVALRKFVDKLDFSSPDSIDMDIFSVGLTNKVADFGEFDPLVMLQLRDRLRVVEMARKTQLQRLEMVVDEGVAEWASCYHIANSHDELRPILPIEADVDKLKPYKSAQNPYRRGLELALKIEKNLGPAFVRLAAQIACAPARILQFELTMKQLKMIQESAPWHPTTRFQRIADLSPEEVSRIVAAPPPTRVIALFALLDASKPSPSEYACYHLKSLEN